MAIGNFAGQRCEAVEDVALQSGAAGGVHELALEADESARGHAIFDAHAAAAVVRHVLQLGLATAERFHDAALVVLVDVDGQRFERFVHHAVDGLGEHARLADGELIAFAAHVLDEDGEMQFAAAGDAEHVGIGGFIDAQRDVALELAHQALANLAAGDELAFLAGERRGIHLEAHDQRGLVDRDRRQRIGMFDVADGVADVHVLDARDGDDVAGHGFGNRFARQTLEGEHLLDLGGAVVFIAVPAAGSSGRP